MFSQKLWEFKLKSAKGKDTVNSLRHIAQTFMANGGSHFDCKEVREFCEEIGTKLHITATYSPWVNSLLEGSNSILLNTLKRLCTSGLAEDKYEHMEKEDLPRNWTDHLEMAIKHLSDHILPALKFSLNKLLLAMPTVIPAPTDPDTITMPMEADIALHVAITEQQQFDGYASMVDHTKRRKQRFDTRVMKRAPGNVIFEEGDLIQVHQTQWHQMFSMNRKLIPMWSIPHQVTG